MRRMTWRGHHLLASIAMMLAFPGATLAQAGALPTGVVGQHEFLFYRYEMAQPGDAADTRASLQLLEKISRHLAHNGVALVLALVPSKVRIYADYLPASLKLDPYTDGKYDAALQYLRTRQVDVADLNRAFLQSPLRRSDTPLFLRLDTHWSPSGALLAAQTVRAAVEQSPAARQAWQATPAASYKLLWASSKVNKRERDLIQQLGKAAPEFALEQVLPFKVTREQANSGGLLQDAEVVGITAIGSSYTDSTTGYPDALRFELQRDLLDISIPVLRGPWVGMENHVQDGSFQRSRPRLLIWEIPERELRSPPNYRFRESRYISDNQEWLLRTAAWIQQSCQSADVQLKPVVAEGSAMRLEFDPPLQPLDYLQFTLPAQHARLWQLEASNRRGEKRHWSISVAEDEQAFEVKLAMPLLPGGVQQLRLQASTAAQAQDFRVCRLPAWLLEGMAAK